MPQAANLVVKDAANVDRTFTLITPAAGDGSWAQWQYKVGDFASSYPTLLIRAAQNANRTARKVEIRFKDPQTFVSADSGLPTQTAMYDAVLTVTIPTQLSESNKPDAVAFLTNIIRAALVQTMLADGSPAT